MSRFVFQDVITDLAGFVLAELVDDEEVTDVGEHEDLLEEFIDSVGAVRLAAHIEDRYGVTFKPADYSADTFRSVHTLASFVCRP